jgi:spore coat protein CotH
MRVAALIAAAAALTAQPPFPPGGGFGPGFGPPGMEHREIVKDFDKDGDGRLNKAERAAARASLANEPRRGPKVSPSQVRMYKDEPLYDPWVLRTLFLEFEDTDWEKQLADFKNTDVEVPAKLTVDGKVVPEIGVRFRGMSSFMSVEEGRKRSFNLSIDYADKEARLGGYRTINLLNSHQDPTFLRSVLYLGIAREYVPAPKANFMRVVINGEGWGVYVSTQQFNTDFVRENYPESKGGRRWKVQGSPMGRGGLAYLGDDPAPYKRIYSIKSKDEPKAWTDLIRLTKVMGETPPDKLVAALSPLLDIDGALKFLALEKVFINNDCYWVRASDYTIYQDDKGKFHVIPHDANETLGPVERMGRGPRPGGPPPFGRGPGPGFGPGFGPPPGGPREHDVKLDPMAGSDEPGKALLHRLMAVPELRQRYIGYVRQIATEWLDWARIGPLARKHHALIAADVATDTRKLYSTEAFQKGLTEETSMGGGRGPFGGSTMSLKDFVEKRRAFLLAWQPKP